jgi:hypothetical protein
MAYSAFPLFMQACDGVLMTRLGMSHLDIGDAPWYDYFNDELTPEEAVALALMEWNDMEWETLEDLGLAEFI